MQQNSAQMPPTANDISNQDVKLFACPFFQRNQSGFGHGKWKICAHGSWKEYHRVREHVYRKHILPTNHCNRCFEDLKDAQTLQQHYNQLQCEPKALLYTTADRIPQLKIQMKRGIGEFEKWKTMYRILFPGDIRIPSPYKDELSYNTEELRVLAAEIERICKSSSSDVRAQLKQIRGVTEQAIRYIKSLSSKAQHNLQEDGGASSSTSRDVMVARYSGTLNVPSTPGLDPILEYMRLNSLFIEDSVSGVSTLALGGQNDTASHAWESPYDMDINCLGIGFHIGDSPCVEPTFFATRTFDSEDASQTREASHDTDHPHCEDSGSSFQY